MLNIPIPDHLQSLVEQQATDAGFSSVSSYVLHLIQQEQQRITVSAVDQPCDRETDPIASMQLPLADRRQVLVTRNTSDFSAIAGLNCINLFA
jgi:hypothetical protein